MKHRMASSWLNFAAAVLPKDCTPAQHKDMRMAFYGGAWALFCMVMRELTPGPEATLADLNMMAELDAELREFAGLAGLETPQPNRKEKLQ
jgi:hypothetical protein